MIWRRYFYTLALLLVCDRDTSATSLSGVARCRMMAVGSPNILAISPSGAVVIMLYAVRLSMEGCPSTLNIPRATRGESTGSCHDMLGIERVTLLNGLDELVFVGRGARVESLVETRGLSQACRCLYEPCIDGTRSCLRYSLNISAERQTVRAGLCSLSLCIYRRVISGSEKRNY